MIVIIIFILIKYQNGILNPFFNRV